MVNSFLNFELALGKGGVLKSSQCGDYKWPGHQTVAGSQAPKIIPVSIIFIQPCGCFPGGKWWCCGEGFPWLAQAEWWRRAHVLMGWMGNVGLTVVCGEWQIVLWKPESGKGNIKHVASSYQQQIPGPQGDQIDWKEECERETKRIASSCSTPKSMLYICDIWWRHSPVPVWCNSGWYCVWPITFHRGLHYSEIFTR